MDAIEHRHILCETKMPQGQGVFGQVQGLQSWKGNMDEAYSLGLPT